MKQINLILRVMILPIMLFSQILINDFDGAVTEETINWKSVERSPSTLEIRDDSTDAHEGAGALYATASIGGLNEWGSFAQLGYNVSSNGTPMDWSDSDTLSLWIKVYFMPNFPENFVFRVHLSDRPSPDVPKEEYIFEHAEIVDNEQEWVKLNIPLIERETDGGTLPNDEGFVLFPKNWGGGTYNNEGLDLDKLVGYNFSLVTTSHEADEIEVAFDYFTRNGCCASIVSDTDNDMNFSLSANHPNPFNPSTEIQYQIPRPSHVQLNVFNLLGQKVRTLVNTVQPAGIYHVSFVANNLPAGIYFFRIETDDFIETRKMTLVP
ncbi:T9SS type A sorting domain-containing protein [bacterium]|nr:T9SS type A sorting domain-containing protein [bacterium]